MAEKVSVSRMDARDAVASILADLYEISRNISVDIVKVGSGRKAYRLVALFPYDWDNMTAILEDQVLHPEKFDISTNKNVVKEAVEKAKQRLLEAKGAACEVVPVKDRSKYPPISLDWNTKTCSGKGDCIGCQIGCSNKGKNILVMEVFARTVGYELPEERSGFLAWLGRGGYLGTKNPYRRG